MLSHSFIDAVKQFGGYKIIFIQDEYEGTEIARNWITNLGIHCVYNLVCLMIISKQFIPPIVLNVRFIRTLTGFVPELSLPKSAYKELSARLVLVGYRGRALPYWYGTLGQEKLNIGVQFKEYALQNRLNVDIEWEPDKRIYGNGWYDFLGSCRATLGTESGANIFDFDGSLRKEIEDRLNIMGGDLTYSDIYEELIAPNENIPMNQISPKLFEAISLKTALILFEGSYSGILVPDLHYISLKKDFSNISEVVCKLQDDAFIQTLTERAYHDVVESKHYSYEQFVRGIDNDIRKEVKTLSKSKSNCPSYVISDFNNKKNIAVSPTNKVLTLDHMIQQSLWWICSTCHMKLLLIAK